MAVSVLLLVMAASRAGMVRAGYQPFYDQQSDTYHSHHVGAQCKQGTTVTPYFSPDHSIDTYVSLINSANESIDIFTPGFSSWSFCTPFSRCQGCTIERQKEEKFPIFPALLNAKHQRNVRVRILTNNYKKQTCEGKITPLEHLMLNGIEVRGYTSTTFMHSKFMIIDKGKKTSISSVNFSYSSFMLNREAGVVLEEGCREVASFHQQVFETDWHKGVPFQVQNTYSEDEMKAITNPSPYPIIIPDPKDIPEAYVTSLTAVEDVTVKEVYTAPDFAREKLFDTLDATKRSLHIAIYEVTDHEFCDELEKLHKRGVDVKMLVSPTIFSESSQEEAEACYQQLYDAGMDGNIRYAPDYYRYSHEKFWIVDNTTVHLRNWAISDYQPGHKYPVYGDPDWKKTNRNMLVMMESPAIVDVFYTVFHEDGVRGTEWMPSAPTCDANIDDCSKDE